MEKGVVSVGVVRNPLLSVKGADTAQEAHEKAEQYLKEDIYFGIGQVVKKGEGSYEVELEPEHYP